MEIGRSKSFEVLEPNQAGEARRGAMTMAREVGFDEVEVGRIGIVVTEAATNMVKHAQGGSLLLQPLEGGPRWGVGALALDRGPGMLRLAEMMRDGVSTSGTSGTGLGAIRRQSSQFDVYSMPGQGTALFAGFWPKNGLPRVAGIAAGGVCVPMHGEDRCGDGWSIDANEDRVRVLVSDGLGHGPFAHEASARAIAAFRGSRNKPIEETMTALHEALRPTRGAAAAIAEIVPRLSVVRYCGVGNIVARIFGSDSERHLVSHFGTLGHDVRRIQAFQYPWSPDAVMVIHSDGLGTKWTLGDYPGLAHREPTLIAGVLYRDHARRRDDVTAVVVRQVS